MNRFERFEIGTLLPERSALVLDTELGVRSLLVCAEDGKQGMGEQQLLTPSEMPVIQTLLASYPDYCPYEVVLSAMTRKSLEKCRERVLWGLQEGGSGRGDAPGAQPVGARSPEVASLRH